MKKEIYMVHKSFKKTPSQILPGMQYTEVANIVLPNESKTVIFAGVLCSEQILYLSLVSSMCISYHQNYCYSWLYLLLSHASISITE